MTSYKTLQEVPAHILGKLNNYFTNVGGDTFVITIPEPELTGGLLARYSRAKTGLQLTFVNEFLDEDGNPSAQKGSELMDRVLNAFGDDSVGELEGVHVGIEDVSQLMTKVIEDRRIGGSPIEQSTRYVKYDEKDAQGNWRYVRPKDIMQSGLGDLYIQANDQAFEVYSSTVSRLSDLFKKKVPRETFEISVERGNETLTVTEAELINDDERRAFRMAYNFTIRCAALDVGRCILPASTLTHLGIHGNGRFFSHLITYLKSQPLEEAVERGFKLEEQLNKVIPTFIKRNHTNTKWAQIDQDMTRIAQDLFKGITPQTDEVTLLPREDYLLELTASCLFPYTTLSLEQIYTVVRELSPQKRQEIFKTYAGERETRRDRTGRGIEAGYPFTFDLVGGFAEYRDLERHRMLTQQRQPLTIDHGFIMPGEIAEVGLEREVEEAVANIEHLNSELRHVGMHEQSQYATCFNHRIRWMMGMNLRAMQHMLELRTQPAGHHSYRAMSMEIARQTLEREPSLEVFLNHVDYTDKDNKIARAKEQSKIARKNLKAGIDASSDWQD